MHGPSSEYPCKRQRLKARLAAMHGPSSEYPCKRQRLKARLADVQGLACQPSSSEHPCKCQRRSKCLDLAHTQAGPWPHTQTRTHMHTNAKLHTPGRRAWRLAAPAPSPEYVVQRASLLHRLACACGVFHGSLRSSRDGDRGAGGAFCLALQKHAAMPCKNSDPG